jgi:hypothetical protein
MKNLLLAFVALLVAAPATVRADEGMWTFSS